MTEALQYLNLGVGALLVGVLGYAIRGWVDHRRANEEQILIKAASATLTRLAQIRKPDQDALDAMAALQASETAQIKALQAKAALLL